MDERKFTYDEIMEALGKAAMVSVENANNHAVALQRIEALETLTKGISQDMSSLKGEVSSVKGDIVDLKDNYHVTPEQLKSMHNAANSRIYIILPDEFDRAKYGRCFYRRMYTDAKQYAGLGATLAQTKKRDFQRVIDYFEAWTPSCGCVGLKTIIDKKAEANRKAKELGYN